MPAMPTIGELRHRVTLSGPSGSTQTDADGTPVAGTTMRTAWAKITASLPSRPEADYEAMVGSVIYLVDLRHSYADVTTGWTLTLPNGRKAPVVAVADIWGTRQFVRLVCRDQQ